MTDTAGRNQPVIPPGRELDAEVHVRLFGGCLHPMPWDKEVIEDDNDCETVLTCRACGKDPKQHPNYSTSWDAMRLVVERLVALGYRVQLYVGVASNVVVFRRDAAGEFYNAVAGVEADTLPHAVCLAALAAFKAVEADRA